MIGPAFRCGFARHGFAVRQRHPRCSEALVQSFLSSESFAADGGCRHWLSRVASFNPSFGTQLLTSSEFSRLRLAFAGENRTVRDMKRLGLCCALSLLGACNNPAPPVSAPAAPVVSSAPQAGAGARPAAAAAGSCADCATQNANMDAGAAGSAAGAPASTKPVAAPSGATDDAMDDAGADLPKDAGADMTTAPDAGVKVGPNGRPVGVSECYSAMSSTHPATLRHWELLRNGDLESRGAMIDALSAAATEYPKEQEFALLLGLASLWRVAEPLSVESLDPFLSLETIQVAQRELERAYAMCPTDHRIPAWLGPIKIRMGRMLEDDALVKEGFAVLNKGIEHYPGFVLFSKLLVYADLPASDPEFMKAIDAVRENAVYCGSVASGLSRDPACNNHPHAAHNIEGSAVFLGDMYAKAQDRAAALAAYQSAKAVPTWSSWDYRELLDERISKLDERISKLATPDTNDDLEPAWASQIQCSLCHRD